MIFKNSGLFFGCFYGFGMVLIWRLYGAYMVLIWPFMVWVWLWYDFGVAFDDFSVRNDQDTKFQDMYGQNPLNMNSDLQRSAKRVCLSMM